MPETITQTMLQDRLDAVAPLVCETCDWVTRRADLLPGVRCVLCPRCNDGSLLLLPEQRERRKREAAEARVTELEAALGKAWRMAEEIRDGGYKPEGVHLVAGQICRDAEHALKGDGAK